MATRTLDDGTVVHAPFLPYYLATIWGGGALVLPALAALPWIAFGDNTSQPVGAAVVTFIPWVLLGWIPALVVWLLVRGVVGWIAAARIIKRHVGEGYRQAQQEVIYVTPMGDNEGPVRVPESAVEAPVDSALSDEWTDDQIWAHWREINTMGCCLDYADESGFPSHGGPDCRHPEVVGRA